MCVSPRLQKEYMTNPLASGTLDCFGGDHAQKGKPCHRSAQANTLLMLYRGTIPHNEQVDDMTRPRACQDSDLTGREPDLAELMAMVGFDVCLLSTLLAWQQENSASAEEAAIHFLTSYSDVWSQWIDNAARDRLAAFIR